MECGLHGSTYTQSQNALYHIWDTWVAQGCYGSGFVAGGSNPSNSTAYQYYEGLAKQKDYSATIYFFTPARNITTGTYPLQNLILADETTEPEDPEDPDIPTVGTTTIRLTKEWDDNNNEYGNRPEKISFTLMTVSSDYVTEGVINDVNISATNAWIGENDYVAPGYYNVQLFHYATENTWSVDIKGVPENYNYFVYEQGVGSAYESSDSKTISADENFTVINGGGEYIITNTLTSTSVSGTKKWTDSRNAEGKRPETVTIELLANGEHYAYKTIPAKPTSSTATSTSWSYSFTGLPLYRNGTKITYTVDELPVEGYTKTISGKTITNTVEEPPETTTVTVNKIWEDDSNARGKRPDSIQIQLLANGTPYGNVYDLTGEYDTWSLTIGDLPITDDSGNTITYSVQEISTISGYTSTIEQSPEIKNLFIITNTLNKMTDITINKKWEDDSNSRNMRPESISVQLLANGSALGDPYELTGTGDTWTLTIEELPVVDDSGNDITYSVKEISVPGYETNIVQSGDVFTITNTLPETSVTITKKWDDNNDQDGKRPNSIQVILQANGEDEQTVILSGTDAENEWTKRVANLLKYDENGTEIVYTVKEISVSGYETKTVQSGNVFTITNTHTPEIIEEIPVTKIWEDNNNQDGIRPESVQLSLLANGTEVQKITLNSDNEWTGKFTNLPKYANGTEITYTVQEMTGVEGYASTVQGNATDGFIVTNKHEQEMIEIPVTKIWDDNNDQDGKRPESIDIELKSNGQHEQTITLSGTGNTWTGEFTGLSKYLNGTEIVYTVEEIAEILGYTSTQEVDESTGTVEITNTHIPETIDIPITKIWDDNDNQDGIRPPSVGVSLLANGTEVQTVTLTGTDSEWQGEVTNLPKYANGTEIVYTVQEMTGAEGYTSTVEGNAVEGFIVTNTHIPITREINVTKIWDDNNDQDGIRPDSINVVLQKNGEDVPGLLAITLSGTGNTWTGKFGNIPVYEAGQAIEYTVRETATLTGYTTTYSGSTSAGFTITNTHTPETIDISITKVWDDDSNSKGKRPSSIQVNLLANGVIYKTVTLNGTWSHTFQDVPKYEGGNEIDYTVSEDVIPDGYKCTVVENQTNKKFTITNTYTENRLTITNTHEPEKINVTVKKVWDDNENLDDLRPNSIEVTLYEIVDGVESESKDENGNVRKITLTAPNWEGTFNDVYKYAHEGKEIRYTAKDSVSGYVCAETNRITTTDTNGTTTVTVTITNTHTPEYAGYTEITGRVWLDGATGKSNDINGIYGDVTDSTNNMSDVKIRLYDKNGQPILSSYYSGTLANNNLTYTNNQYAVPASDGTYTIRVNYDNSNNVYKLHKDSTTVAEALKTGYVEFEYNAMKYTTVVNAVTGANTSKVIENETQRNNIDANYPEVTASNKANIENIVNNTKITASTENVISFETYGDTYTTNRYETVKYCEGPNGIYQHTDIDEAWEDIITQRPNTHYCDQEYCAVDSPSRGVYNTSVTTIQNVNLGLFRREQPDVAVSSDLSKVDVVMNGQQFRYLYAIRSKKYDNKDENYIQAVFQNKDTYTYRRPVNPSDIAYIANTGANANEMRVFVTYEVKIQNQSSTLPIIVNSIVNHYDSNYTLQEIKMGDMILTDGDARGSLGDIIEVQASISTSTSTHRDGHMMLQLDGLGIVVMPQQKDTPKVYITYEIKDKNTIISLFNNQTPLNNATEILSYKSKYGNETLYAEQRTHLIEEAINTGSGRGNDNYAGYDYDSYPGNARIQLVADEDGQGRLNSTDANGNIIEIPEDDTDIAPAFVLERDTPKTVSGTVFEDSDITNNDERLGDGKYNTGEKTVKNVKVELYEVGNDTTPAGLYVYDNNGNPVYENGSIKTTPAVQYTSDTNGEYSFTGVITGKKYYLKFTYGDDITPATNELTAQTQINNDTRPAVNARDYKSTTIQSDDHDPNTLTDGEIIAGILQTPFEGLSDNDNRWYWYTIIGDNNSVAVDDMTDRLRIEDLYYKNFHEVTNNGTTSVYVQPENMTAYTKPFIVKLEYDAGNIGQTDENANDKNLSNIEIPNNLSKLDFGIIERPREDLFVEKTISYAKLTLANGQVLLEGDPRDPETYLKSAKAIGFQQIIDTGEKARAIDEKLLTAELDAELTQGAQLEILYNVSVTNNNEIDYDYGTDADYVTTYTHAFDKFIATSSKANYYYYGISQGFGDPILATIELVDYLSEEVVYEKSNTEWYEMTKADVEGLNDNGGENKLISQATYNEIINNDHKVLQPIFDANNPGSITLKRTDTSTELTMFVSKLLTAKEENQYDNAIEIIKIDGKTARTIQYINGEIVQKTYKPGNYIPNQEPEYSEQDDDRVRVVVTPPTGITKYIIPYALAILAGLMVVVVGIVIIKKKVLIKKGRR